MPELSPPSPQDVARLLDVVGDDAEFVVYLQLSAVSGARRSELLALRWADVDFANSSMTIRRAIVAGPHGLVEKDTKTHSVRRVALDDGTTGRLRRYLEFVNERAALCGIALSPDCLVFAADVAMRTPCYPDSVSRRFCKARDRAGIDGVRLHDLRHYVATRLLSAGVDVCTASAIATRQRL
jgi:integrase